MQRIFEYCLLLFSEYINAWIRIIKNTQNDRNIKAKHLRYNLKLKFVLKSKILTGGRCMHLN